MLAVQEVETDKLAFWRSWTSVLEVIQYNIPCNRKVNGNSLSGSNWDRFWMGQDLI